MNTPDSAASPKTPVLTNGSGAAAILSAWCLFLGSGSSSHRWRLCMVRRATARESLGEETSLRQCIRPLSGDPLSWP
jgi:hypothetical protein